MKKEFVIFGIVILMAMTFVFADSTNSTNNSNNWQARCEIINSRVDARIALFDSEKDFHFIRFTNVSNTLLNIIQKAQAKEFDISTLQTDLDTLNNMVTQFQTDYADFISSLKNTKNFTCGHSEGQFMKALNISKTKLITVHQDADKIKDYFKNTIKTDVNNLKEQAKKSREQRKAEIQEKMKERENKMGNKTMNNLTNHSPKKQGGLRPNESGMYLNKDKINNSTPETP